MGNFETHMRWGVGSYIFLCVCITGIAVYRGTQIPFTGLGAAFPLTLAGAGFPDIDHHSSKPHRYLKKAVFVVSTALTAYVFFSEGRRLRFAFGDVPQEVFTAGVGAVSSLFVGTVASYSVSFFRPRHRGVTHTLSAGLTVSLVVGAGVWRLTTEALVGLDPALLAGVTSLGFAFGFGSHLQCDGMLLSRLPSC
ncbi:MAG: metal-dependent hydrolase [Halobacteria archaeon]|nr:metal-dependent hydrolase [Halobacteria archaeon]